jgi:hypothetical protein
MEKKKEHHEVKKEYLKTGFSKWFQSNWIQMKHRGERATRRRDGEWVRGEKRHHIHIDTTIEPNQNCLSFENLCCSYVHDTTELFKRVKWKRIVVVVEFLEFLDSSHIWEESGEEEKKESKIHRIVKHERITTRLICYFINIHLINFLRGFLRGSFVRSWKPRHIVAKQTMMEKIFFFRN